MSAMSLKANPSTTSAIAGFFRDAINGVGGGLRLAATVSGPGDQILLTNRITGAFGNVAITDNVSNAGITTSGKSGGLAYDCPTTIGCKMSQDCNIGLACSGTNACTATTFAVTVTNPGGGTVSADTGPIACGVTCTGNYAAHSMVILTAAPASGFTFTGWTGACAGVGPCVLTLDAAKAVGAVFSIGLTVDKTGSTGTGEVKSGGAEIDCLSGCTTASASFPYGTDVTLTATPDANSDFTGWSGGGCSGTLPCTVNVTAATTVFATFTRVTFAVNVTSNDITWGTVTSAPAGITCGATCSASFDRASTVTLTAAPIGTHTFSGWGGACSGTLPTCNLTIDAIKNVTATFL
jgi:hypothetical protein